VNGEGGADVIDINLTDVDVGQFSTVRVLVDGKDGNDNITVDTDGDVDGQLLFQVFGDNDNDTIAVNVLLDNGSTGVVQSGRSDIHGGAALVEGNLGDDTLRFAVRQEAGSAAEVKAIVDGGFGFGWPDHDVGRHTSNVQTVWLEEDIVIQ
jgi:hypothetical protein